MLTPANIDEQRFSTTRLKEGYVQDEVDDFLDRVQEDYAFLTAQVERLERENQNLAKQLELRVNDTVTTRIPAVAQTPSAVAERLLAVAEEAARKHEEDAKAKADEIIREAGLKGARKIEEATEAAEKIKSDGLAEKYRRNDELDKKAELLNGQISDLNQRAQDLRVSLTQALNAVKTVTSP